MFRWLLLLAAGIVLAPHAFGERQNFDQGWKFHLGSANDPIKDFNFANGSFSPFAKAGTDQGPIGLGFNDSAWRTLDLPHDWSVELPFDPRAEAGLGSKPVGRAFPDTSVGWYRKSFDVPATDAGKRFRISFDGIFRDSTVWINGHLVGRNMSGYIGDTYDLSDYIRFGGRNVISVRVDASYAEGWFYEGAGIYRHVWLTESEPLYLVEDGTYFETTGDTLRVSSEIRNESDKDVSTQLKIDLVDPQGNEAAALTIEGIVIPARQTVTATGTIKLKPHLWNPDDPYLYRATATINTDSISKNVGFRTMTFDPNLGFSLNGKILRIQGTCNHQDMAGVGSAVPDALQVFRIKQLKAFGCNFYRTSHNAPTPELLDACDRLGMMVLDETRMFGSTGEAMSQLTRMVRRDRNHPSVIFWSLGNEEWGTQSTPESARIAKSMIDAVHRLDPTRKTTYAANDGAEMNGINSVIDVRGFNYGLGDLDKYHAARPNQPVIGSEVASTVTDRGEYANDPRRAYVEAYDRQGVGWGSSAEEWWKITLARPWFAGGFVWTGFDYRGEPTPYGWPNVSSHFGILDTCGFFKDLAYYYQAWWTNQPVLHILPHWNWAGKEGQPIDVWVFSNHEEVELLLNGVSQGKKSMERGGHLSWKVPYAPGSLVARGYDHGQVTQTEVVQTTGPATRLVFESMNGDEKVAVIAVKALDAKGALVPLADSQVTFEIDGPGSIMGVGNGDPSSHEPDTIPPTMDSLNLAGWKYRVIDGSLEDRPEVKPGYATTDWKDVADRGNRLAPNTSAVYVTTFEVSDPARYESLLVSPIDDLGWVYLNGELLGTTNSWSESFLFKTAGKLKAGQNTLAVVCKNNGNTGGFSGEASLIGTPVPGHYSRALFHGLAEVIVDLRKGGSTTLRAKAPGLTDAVIQLGSR